MSAIMHRSFNLICNTTGCDSQYFRGRDNESRAAVRRRAAQAGWTHVRSHTRNADHDYCPACKPEDG